MHDFLSQVINKRTESRWARRLMVQFVALLIVASALSYIPGSSEASTIPGRDIHISPSTVAQMHVDIWGERVVWTDYRNGNGDVYMYNITTKVVSRLVTNSSDHLEVSIWGDYVAYEVHTGSSHDLFLYNIVTGVERPIANDSLTERYPDIWNDRIVYVTSGWGNSTIRLYNITTGTTTNITTDTSPKDAPKIHGDIVVWVDYRVSYNGVYMYDIGSSKERSLWGASSNIIHDNVEVWGDKVVHEYFDYDDFSRNIGCINLTEDEGFKVTDTTAWAVEPAMWKDWIVYRDNSSGRYMDYVFDIASGRYHVLRNGFTRMSGTEMFGDNVVWNDQRDKGFSTYMITIDRDLDGVSDSFDAFPDNPNDYKDTDGDGIGDNMDDDADGNGVPDASDVGSYIANSLANINTSLNDIMYNLSYPTAELKELAKNVSYIRDNLTFPASLVSKLLTDVSNLNQTSQAMLANLSMDLRTVNSSLHGVLDRMTVDVLSAIYEHNASLHNHIVSQISMVTRDVAELDTHLNDAEGNLTGLLVDVIDDIGDLDGWLRVVTDSIEDKLDGVNATLQARMDSVEGAINDLQASLEGQLSNIEMRLYNMEGNLSSEHAEMMTDLQALSTLVVEVGDDTLEQMMTMAAQLNTRLDDLENTSSDIVADLVLLKALNDAMSNDLADVREQLVDLALNLSEHDRDVAEDLIDMADTISAFEEQTASDLADIDEALKELDKMGVILGQLDDLDGSLEQAKIELNGTITDTGDDVDQTIKGTGDDLDRSIAESDRSQTVLGVANMALIVLVVVLLVMILLNQRKGTSSRSADTEGREGEE